MARRGRPATFDRAQALDRALELFWARGYEGTTLEGLQDAMGGISPPSFYNAFGSKEALFQEAVKLYLARVGEPSVSALQNAATARDGIEAMLRLVAESISRPGKPHGCLLVLGAMNCAPANKGPQDALRAIRQRAPRVIRQRLERGVADGDLPKDLDTAAVAAFYATIVHGLGVRAGDGASRAALMAAVDGAMAAWETLMTSSSASSASRRKSKMRGAPTQAVAG